MERSLRKSDRISSLIWLIVGISFCAGSIPLKLWDFQKPGPGFMPFLSGALLGLFGLILFFSSTAAESAKGEKARGKGILIKKSKRRLVLSFSILFGYILLFEPLGFFFSTLLFFFFLFKLTDPKRWLTPFFSSGLAVIVSYLIFSVWLKVSLPSGILKF